MRSPLAVGATIVAVLLGAACPAPLGAQSLAGVVQPGDRVLLHVVGEPQLSDTFTVVAGPSLELPTLGTLSLAGVARDSVEPPVTAFLSRYLNHPVVHAQVLLRLGVLGEVARPGFYALPVGALLEDLIMAGGGMTRDARFDRANVLRNEKVLLRQGDVQHAVGSGTTLDALALRSGDVLQIPRRADQESRVRILGALVALPIAVYGLVRLF
jgi:polysaccharide export outer membrane protein